MAEPNEGREPEEQLPREALIEAVRVYSRLYGVMLALPILYLLACLGVREWWFEKEGVLSLVRMSPAAERWTLYSFIALAVMAQLVLLGLKARYALRMIGAREKYAQLILLLRRRLMAEGMICDTVSFLGLIYFLLTGDLRGMLGFGVASYLLYAQIHPRDGVMKRVLGGSTLD